MWIGVHYEYPFGGMTKDRPERKPKGAKDGRRDLVATKNEFRGVAVYRKTFSPALLSQRTR